MRTVRSRTVLKKCTKCGHEALHKPRVRHCRVQRFGPRSYWCYGPLVTVKVQKEEAGGKVSLKVPLGAVLAQGKDRKPQVIALHKLTAIRKRIAEANTHLGDLAKKSARIAKKVKTLETSATYYARRASMTDAEVEAERQKKKAAAERRASTRRTRMITVEDE